MITKIYPKEKRNSHQILITTIVIFLTVFLYACQEEAPQPAPKEIIPVDSLYQNPWVLLAFGDPDNPTIIPKNTTIIANFKSDGILSGNSGCNQYSTSFTASEDGTMTIQGDIKTTMMVCPKTQMDTEAAYLDVLRDVIGFNFNPEGRLVLTYEDQQGKMAQLVFAVGQVPLENTNWVLTSFGDPALPQRISPGLTINAVFTADGKVTGSSGCNRYSAGYTLQDDTIAIGPVASTKMSCPEVMDIEDSFLTALGYASSYQIAGPNLTIKTADDQVLNFTSASLPLETTLWTLVSLNQQPVPGDVNVTAFFQPEPSSIGKETTSGTLAGNAGCNQYSSTYSFSDTDLTISALITTLMACEENVMALESEFLTAIEQTTAFSIQGDNLELTTQAGILVFSASRTPLTGALWVLDMLGDVEQPVYPVEGANFTIQFTRSPNAPTGVASGTTGCNEYAAAFTANLTEIKINLPITTEITSCSPGLVDQEQLFFLALNDALEYRILGDKLVIPYDNNRQALVFTATQVGFDTNIPLTSLDGTYWYLWTINNQPIENGTSISSEFTILDDQQSGTMEGSAGCNLYSAKFGPGLSIETTINSSQVCDLPAGVMEQEQAYLQILSRAYGFWLTGDQFILNSGLGTLTYRMIPAPQSADQTHLLQANEWYLVSYNNRLSTPSDKGDPSLRFNADNTVNGYTGCNDFKGTYKTNVNQLNVSELATTLTACPNSVFADQERTFLEVLQNARMYQVFDTSLQITSDQGVLNFSNSPVNKPGEPRPPDARIIAPALGQVSQIVLFDGSRSVADVPITRYQWDFGDGGRGNGKTVEYTYRQPGKYLVQMTVTDQRGYRDSDSVTIEILPKNAPQPTPTAVGPTATPQSPTPTPEEPTATPETPQTPTITPEVPEPTPTEPAPQIPPSASLSGPGQGFPGEPVTFDASGSLPGSSSITTYQWDFGDGSASPPQTQPTINTIYIHGGNYNAVVTVTDQNGLTSTASSTISVQARLDTAVWSLDTLGQTRLIPGTAITLQFLNGQISGFAGCNTYNGEYTATQNEDGSFQVTNTNLTFTKRACANEIMQQEAQYFEFLASTQIARINQNRLELQSPNGFLVFIEVGSPQPR